MKLLKKILEFFQSVDRSKSSTTVTHQSQVRNAFLKRMFLTPFWPIFLLTGCENNGSFVSEMEAAYQKSRSQADVSKVVQHRFPNGSSAEQTKVQLSQLKEDGFSIHEYHYEGSRVWPDGEFLPYREGRKNLQILYPPGTKAFVGKISYGKRLFIFSKNATVEVVIRDEKVQNAAGKIWESEF